METKFRPIPITILDILAIFLPGFVWLILIATAFETFRYHGGEAPTPILAWDHIVRSLSVSTWFAPFPLLVASLLLGYLLKPSAIVITEQMATQIVIRLRYKRLLYNEELKAKEGKSFLKRVGSWVVFLLKVICVGSLSPKFGIKFPFNDIFKNNLLYRAVNKILEERLDCAIPDERLKLEDFPGNQIFATAKIYLKALSPALWEESERREAEVRMAGVMYLAFFFSFLLSIVVLRLSSRLGDETASVWGWFVLSVVGVIVAGESFSLLRVSEVGYTYLNMLVAEKCSPPAEGAEKASLHKDQVS